MVTFKIEKKFNLKSLKQKTFKMVLEVLTGLYFVMRHVKLTGKQEYYFHYILDKNKRLPYSRAGHKVFVYLKMARSSLIVSLLILLILQSTVAYVDHILLP